MLLFGYFGFCIHVSGKRNYNVWFNERCPYKAQHWFISVSKWSLCKQKNVKVFKENFENVSHVDLWFLSILFSNHDKKDLYKCFSHVR